MGQPTFTDIDSSDLNLSFFIRGQHRKNCKIPINKCEMTDLKCYHFITPHV